jgi:hypothetical protein
LYKCPRSATVLVGRGRAHAPKGIIPVLQEPGSPLAASVAAPAFTPVVAAAVGGVEFREGEIGSGPSGFDDDADGSDGDTRGSGSGDSGSDDNGTGKGDPSIGSPVKTGAPYARPPGLGVGAGSGTHAVGTSHSLAAVPAPACVPPALQVAAYIFTENWTMGTEVDLAAAAAGG